MKKSEITCMPSFYDRYINLVPDMNITEALTEFGSDYIRNDFHLYEQLGDRVYDKGKWTVKEVIQHITDTERIFSYRALRLARFDKTPLPGFDENKYAEVARGGDRSLTDLMDEWSFLRNSNILLFKSFDREQLLASGRCSDTDIDVLSIGFAMAGHVIHHKNIISERYLILLNK